jgi:hypothetical protein
MKPSPSTVSTFRSGQKTDLTNHISSNDSYRRLYNGRVMWNAVEGDGKTGDVMPLRGTKWEDIGLPYGYHLIGGAEVDSDSAIIISSNGSYSEIGIATDQKEAVNPLSYRTYYNDQFDPNGDKLGFRDDSRLRVVADVDSPTRFLVYFLEPLRSKIFCVNMYRAKNEQGLPYHLANDSNQTFNIYPKFWSAHHFDLQPDCQMGELVFQQQKTVRTGGLSSGVYRYAYRLTDEYGEVCSTWSNLSLPVYVTAEKEPTGLNHHERVMGESGKGSKKVNVLSLTGLDRRWWGVELGYTYTFGQNTYEPFQVIGRYILGGTVSNNQFTITHASEGGIYSVPLEALSSLQATINTASDIELHDNRLFIAGPVLAEDIKPIDTGVDLRTTNLNLFADETRLPKYTKKADPITNSLKKASDSIRVQKFVGVNRDYPIIGDYRNYKGVLAHGWFGGYQRESIVDIGVVVYDLKGQPSQVTAIGTMAMPSLAENPSTYHDFTTDLWQISVLGILVSNLRFKKSDLVDENGKMKVSGFSIVRSETRTNILHQGVIMPTVQIVPSAISNKDPKIPSATFPLPWTSNAFDNGYERYPSSHRHWIETWFSKSGTEKGFADFVTIATDLIGAWTHSRVGTHNYYSAETFIEQTFSFDKTTDSVQVVATAMSEYGTDTTYIPTDIGTRIADLANVYNKPYQITSIENPAPNRPKIGEEVKLRSAVQLSDPKVTYEKYDPEDQNLYFEMHQHAQTPIYGGTQYGDALHVKDGLLLTTEGWESVDVTNGKNKGLYHIANYLRVKPDTLVQDDQKSSTTPYFYCGHYQELNLSVLSQAASVDNGEAIQFNGIEVYGGDCYVNLVDFTRLVPFWREACEPRRDNNRDYYPDYAVSHIVPLESRKYNTALRIGRSFAKDCVRMQFESCNGKSKHFDNGVMSKQAQVWGYNKALLHTETIRFFIPRDPNSEYVARRFATIYYSNQTIMGETKDSKRVVLARNKRDIEGVYGGITNIITTMDALYVLQKRALVFLPTKNREMLSTGSGAIYFGDGAVIEKERYINTENGCQRYAVVKRLGRAIYWIDEKNKHFCRFSQDGLSKLDEDKMVRVETGIQIDKLSDYNIVTNANQNEVMVSLKGADWKGFIFHEAQNCLVGEMPVSFDNGIMVGRKQIVSGSQNGRLASFGEGEYGQFFDVDYPTILTFDVAPSPEEEKVYNVAFVSLGGDYTALDSITGVTSDNNNPIQHDITLPNPHSRHWGGRYRVPLVHPTARLPRLRGQVLSLTFTFTVKNKEPFLLHSTETFFTLGRYN